MKKIIHSILIVCSLFVLTGCSTVQDWVGGDKEPAVSPAVQIRGIGFVADWNTRDNKYITTAREKKLNAIMIEYGGTYWDAKTIEQFRELRPAFVKYAKACKKNGMMPYIALLNGNDPMSSRFSASDIRGEVEWMNKTLRDEGIKEAILVPVLEWPNSKSGGISDSKAREYHRACEEVWSYKLAWNKDSRPSSNPGNYHYREWHPQSVNDDGKQASNQILVTDHGVTGRQLGVNKGGYPNRDAIVAWVQKREARNDHWIIFTHVWASGDAYREGAEQALFDAIEGALK